MSKITPNDFLLKNLEEPQIAKENLEKIARNFLTSEKSSISVSIPYKELIPLFSTKKLLELRKKLGRKKLPNEFIFASIRQRGKSSIVFDKVEKYSGSTWNESFIASAFISWFTQTSVPVVKINVNTLETDDVLTVWDGESKFQILYYFVNGATDLFRVLKDDGLYVDEVDNFVEHSERFKTKNNEKLINKLLSMFDLARETKRTYINIEWMLENDFSVLITSLLNLSAVCVFQNLPEMVEGEAYHREGKVGAKQTDVQLTNSRMIEAWYEPTRFDETSKPSHRFKDALTHSLFNQKDSSVFFRDVYDDIYEGEDYQGYDQYIYDFFLSLLFDINGNKVQYGLPEKLESNILSGIARPYDKGTLIVSDKMGKYKEYLNESSVSDSQKEAFKKKLISIFRMLEQVFGYPGPNNFHKYPAGIGLLDERVITLTKPTSKKNKKKNILSIKEKQTLELRNLLGEFNIQRERGLGFIEKFVLSNHLMVYIICKSITYILQNSNVKENQLTDILVEIINSVKTDWVEFAFNYEPTKADDKILYYDAQEWGKVLKEVRGEDENSNEIPPKFFGLLYAVNGGNLEKVAYVFLKFLGENVQNVLDSIYLNATSTAKEMREFKMWLEKVKKIPNETFFIYDTINNIPLYLDSFDIGHPDAESQGNILFHKQFLLEERDHNRHQFQTDSKDVQSYYRCLMANHNDVFNHTKNAFSSVLENPNDFEDTLNKMNEAKQALQNLKYLLEYLGIQYDEKASYKNGTVQKEEYIK